MIKQVLSNSIALRMQATCVAGCVHQGVYHASGSQWKDPTDPCRVFTCKAGVATESNIQCYTPCLNPVSPSPSKCCAVCPGKLSFNIHIILVLVCAFQWIKRTLPHLYDLVSSILTLLNTSHGRFIVRLHGLVGAIFERGGPVRITERTPVPITAPELEDGGGISSFNNAVYTSP
uniref:(California timema) hypothetical protein n=1 Tax=Timema californicum TaxID=61474 RepID=A0A7R9J8R9_TIMCA|nr:unnamed protein product [Timema californicum]